MKSSLQLWERACNVLPGGVNSPVRAFKAVGGSPFFVEKAEGPYLFTVDGKKLIDYVGTWGPAILGHAPEVVLETLADILPRGLSFGVPNPFEVTMAETICRLVPSVEKVRMVNSGTEATMSTIRLARGATGRDHILKFEGCYHGHVDSLLVKAGSGALTFGSPDSPGVPKDLAALTYTLPFNDLEAVEQLFTRAGETIAAIILEPVPANAGLFLPKPGFLEGLRKLCSQYGALLIFDEVMTGFRVAPGGAQEIYSINPDLSAFGKVIGGGLPVGAFGGRADLMEQLSPSGPIYQAGTLSGNPLAMAAGLAQLGALEKRDATGATGWERLEKVSLQLEEALLPLCQERELFWVRQGSLFCLHFQKAAVHNLAEAKRGSQKRFALFFHECLRRGLYLAPSPFEAGFISLAHSREVIGQTASIIEEALVETFSK